MKKKSRWNQHRQRSGPRTDGRSKSIKRNGKTPRRGFPVLSAEQRQETASRSGRRVGGQPADITGKRSQPRPGSDGRSPGEPQRNQALPASEQDRPVRQKKGPSGTRSNSGTVRREGGLGAPRAAERRSLGGDGQRNQDESGDGSLGSDQQPADFGEQRNEPLDERIGVPQRGETGRGATGQNQERFFSSTDSDGEGDGSDRRGSASERASPKRKRGNSSAGRAVRQRP